MTKHSDQAGGGSRPSSVPLSSDRDPSAGSTHTGPGSGSTQAGSTNPARQASQAAQGVVEQAREQAKTLAAEAKNLASEATEQTAELAGRATQQVNTVMTEQKQWAAARLGTLAGALREAARKLGDDELGGRVGQYAQRAADQVDSMSSYVRTAELQSFVRDAGQFARRRPEVFIGGAFLTGLLAARFLKASGSHTRRYESHAGLPARPSDFRQPYMPMGGR
jgi:hypothetical protein